MSNLLELPPTAFAPSNSDIAERLRQMADYIENDVPIKTVFLICEKMDGTLERSTMGHPCDLARAMGILTIAVIRATQGDIN